MPHAAGRGRGRLEARPARLGRERGGDARRAAPAVAASLVGRGRADRRGCNRRGDSRRVQRLEEAERRGPDHRREGTSSAATQPHVTAEERQALLDAELPTSTTGADLEEEIPYGDAPALGDAAPPAATSSREARERLLKRSKAVAAAASIGGFASLVAVLIGHPAAATTKTWR